MAKKASLRSGRCGSMIHNFDIRRDNIEGYDDRHINRDLSDINIYVYNNDVQADGVHLAKQEFSELLKNKAFSGDAHAKEIYAELYESGLEARNQTYIKQGHKERCKTILSYTDEKGHLVKGWYDDEKYRARETIIQIGNHKDTTLDKEHIEDIKKVRDELQACIEQYALEYTKKYGSNYKVLNWTIHCDEIENGSVHAHLQDTFFIKDKDGNFTPNQNKALEQMGVKLPNPEKKKSLHNSLIKSFTAEQRQRFTEICKEHGLEVELYDAAKITERNDSKTLHQNTIHLDAEIEEKQKQVEKLQDSIDELTPERDRLSSERENLKNEIAELTSKKDSVSNEVDQVHSELAQLQNNIDKTKKEAEKEKQKLIKAHEDREQEELKLNIIKDKNIPELEKKVQDLKDEASLLEEYTIPQHRQDIKDLKDKSDDLASQLKKGEETKAELEKDKAKLTKEIAVLKAERSSVEYAAETFKSIQANLKPELEKAKLSSNHKVRTFKKADYKTQLGHKDVYLVPEFDLDNLITYQYDHMKLKENVQTMFTKIEDFLKNAFKDLIDNLSRREQAVSQKEAEIKPLHAKAAEHEAYARAFMEHKADYINSQAEKIADKKIAQLQDNAPFQAPYKSLLQAVESLGATDQVAELEKDRLHKLYQKDARPSIELLSDLIGETEAKQFREAEIKKNSFKWGEERR